MYIAYSYMVYVFRTLIAPQHIDRSSHIHQTYIDTHL